MSKATEQDKKNTAELEKAYQDAKKRIEANKVKK